MSGPGPACCFDPRRGVFEDDAFRRSQPQGRGGRKVNLRVGFAARDHVAADPGVEIRLDTAFFQHEIHIGLVARRTYGAAYACVAEPLQKVGEPGHRHDLGGVDLSVDGFLLFGECREPLFADHLRGHDEPHDVVVAHAVCLAEFLLPVADAVAFAEDFERTDVDGRVVHECPVHVEYCTFYHSCPLFSSPKVVKIPGFPASVHQNLSFMPRLTAKFWISCPGFGSRCVTRQMKSTRSSRKMFSTPNPTST